MPSEKDMLEHFKHYFPEEYAAQEAIMQNIMKDIPEKPIPPLESMFLNKGGTPCPEKTD